MNRRGFLTGLGVILAAPAIVRAGALMPVKALPPLDDIMGMGRLDGPLIVGDFYTMNVTPQGVTLTRWRDGVGTVIQRCASLADAEAFAI